MKHLTKRISVFLLVLTLLFTCGCDNSGSKKKDTDETTGPISNLSKPDAGTVPVGEATDEEKEAFANSTPENDTDVGLKNIKIDTAEGNLTDQQKAVLAYFDDDYLSPPSYEFLRRYPNVFSGAQMRVWGTVKKVINMDADNYEVVLWLGVGQGEYGWVDDDPTYEGHYLYLTGKTGSAWFMEGDTLLIYGRYTGIKTLDIDGTSYTIPQLNVYREYFDKSIAPNDIYRYIEKCSADEIKNIAECIFGQNIEVRVPIPGTDIQEDIFGLWEETSGGKIPYYIVELENQSNAKFTKYFFYAGADADYTDARVSDAKDALNPSGIERNIEFAADFKHFFLFTYDTNLENLTLEYYDSNLNKVWKREFPETTNAIYDYTKNNIYLVANNELYIINTETGEDTYAPSYVGEKAAIRKLNDGILLVSKNKSDGVMKISLKGDIIWKTNLVENTHFVEGIQIIGDTIVLDQYYWNSSQEYGTHYVVLDNATGKVLIDATSIN